MHIFRTAKLKLNYVFLRHMLNGKLPNSRQNFVGQCTPPGSSGSLSMSFTLWYQVPGIFIHILHSSTWINTCWCWLENLFIFEPLCNILRPTSLNYWSLLIPSLYHKFVDKVGEGVSGHCLIWASGMLPPKLRHILGCLALKKKKIVKKLTLRRSNHFLKIQWEIHFFTF